MHHTVLLHVIVEYKGGGNGMKVASALAHRLHTTCKVDRSPTHIKAELAIGHMLYMND